MNWAEAFFYSVCVLGGLGAFSALVIGWVAMRFIRFEETSMEEHYRERFRCEGM